jgi:hypothetical protein
MNKTLGGAAEEKSSKTEAKVVSRQTAKAEPKSEAKPEPVYESPEAIRQGLTQTELRERFGPASLQLSGADGGLILSYVRKGSALDVIVRNGRVAEVRRADGSK